MLRPERGRLRERLPQVGQQPPAEPPAAPALPRPSLAAAGGPSLAGRPPPPAAAAALARGVKKQRVEGQGRWGRPPRGHSDPVRGRRGCRRRLCPQPLGPAMPPNAVGQPPAQAQPPQQCVRVRVPPRRAQLQSLQACGSGLNDLRFQGFRASGEYVPPKPWCPSQECPCRPPGRAAARSPDGRRPHTQPPAPSRVPPQGGAHPQRRTPAPAPPHGFRV